MTQLNLVLYNTITWPYQPKHSPSYVFQKLEGRVASDEDLKLSDTLRYYMRDSAAAKNLLYRRLRSLSNYENANKALDKARSKNKDVSIVRLQVNILLHHLRGHPTLYTEYAGGGGQLSLYSFFF